MYENKEAPPSFRTSHVILIPKAKDPARLVAVEAYRPISLTNTDYKVYTKVLVRRLQTVIKELVGPIRHAVSKADRSFRIYILQGPYWNAAMKERTESL